MGSNESHSEKHFARCNGKAAKLLLDQERRRVITEHRRRWKREWAKKNWAKNKVALSLKSKSYYLKNKGRLLAKERARSECRSGDERAAIALRQKQYHKRTYPHKRKHLMAQTSAYSKAHPEVRKKIHNNWRRKHPEKYRANNAAKGQRYKARKRNADVGDTQINQLIRSWRMDPDFVCAYCKDTFPIAQLHVDHITPIAKGGKHTVNNVCRSCGPCNARKGAKLPAVPSWCYNPITGMFPYNQPAC